MTHGRVTRLGNKKCVMLLIMHVSTLHQFQKLKILGREKPSYGCIIFGMNSPLVPIFRKATFIYRERGAEDSLLKHWIGGDIPENLFEDKNTLTTGQTFLVFVILSAFYCLCLAIFLGEVIFSKTTKRGPNLQKGPLIDNNKEPEVGEAGAESYN